MQQESDAVTSAKFSIRGATSVDAHVGARLRYRRLELGLTQEGLAERLGLTFQQIQKYERGANRIGASRLYELAMKLSVPVQYFFEGLEEGESNPSAARSLGLLTKGDLELHRALNLISEPSQRQALLALARALADKASPVNADAAA